MDYLVFRPVFAENSGVTIDIMKCDLETVLKMNEFLDIRQEFTDLAFKKQQEEVEALNRR